MMAELEVDVPRPVVFIAPHDRVIPHLYIARRLITVFVHVRQHMHIRPRRPVVRVPLVVLDHKALRQSLHHRMLRRLHMNRPRRKLRDIALELDPAHEVVKERRHLEPVELPQQGRMMKPDIADRSLLHRLLERGLCHRRPPVRRIIQLHEQLVLRQIIIRDRVCRANVVHREPFLRPRLLQKLERGIHKALVQPLPGLRQRNHAVPHRRRGLRARRRRREQRQHQKHSEMDIAETWHRVGRSWLNRFGSACRHPY